MDRAVNRTLRKGSKAEEMGEAGDRGYGKGWREEREGEIVLLYFN